MGRKQQWFKAYSEASLADEKLLSLGFPEQGVFWCMVNFLRTQTDTPGYFIIGGKILDENDIFGKLRVYQKTSKGNLRHVQKWTKRVLRSNLISQLKDGTFYSPRIVEEYKEYTIRQKAGKARYYGSGDQRGDQCGDVEEKRIRIRGSGTGHRNPATHFRGNPDSVPNAPTWEELGGTPQPKTPADPPATKKLEESPSDKDPGLGR